MKKKFQFLLLIASVMFFIGCANQQATINQSFTDPHVRVENPSLYNWLKFDFINYVKRDDGLIEFEARFTNFSNVNKTISYKINWRDLNGFTKKTLMSRWSFTEVEARRALVIHGISPDVKTSDFEVVLQEPTSDDKLREDSYHKQYSN